ncbi:MAG TPA: peptidylprolyl isomerase, partial [Sedimentisphaerales bacterium]|nr:peptidylprolyl isomerase [Sedimentisphaerales bacterium]
GEDFAALAARYSGDHGRDRGGLWNPIEPGSLAPPYDVIEKTAVEMEPGAISDPVFAGGYFFIIRLERKQVSGHIPFEEVQHDIQRRLNQSRREQAFDTIMRKRLDMTKIGDIDKFVEACVAALYADLQRVTPPSGSSQ